MYMWVLPRARFVALTVIGVCLALPLRGEAPQLSLPIDCTLGEDCYIQNYVDHDPGPGYSDFTCAQLTYDGHKGTDFALITDDGLSEGVMVKATSKGRVVGVRDGMADGTFLNDPASIEGRECGNGVVIDHGEGWQTQYCHLKNGSVTVSSDESVETGTPLGQVGLSGKTEFPHLHLSLRHNENVIDPFDPEGNQNCEEPSQRTLWHTPAPHYQPGGTLSAGFADTVPDYDHVKSGRANAEQLPADAPALVVWGLAFGGRAGDTVLLEIVAPDGSTLITHTVDLEKPQARFYRAAGKRRPDSAWPQGIYQGRVSLLRDEQRVSTQDTTVTIRE